MGRLDQQFDEQDRLRLNAAVQEAETQTSAQIVPVIAAASGRYDRAEDLFGLLLGIAAAAGVWLALPDTQVGSDSWAGFTPASKLGLMAAALVAGFIAGTIAAAYGWALRRPFTPRREMREQTARAASAAFFDQSLHQTRAGTGLLIYLSWYERRAVILADQAVLEAVGQNTLDTLCRDLTTLIQETDATEALCQTIRRAGQQLAEALPAAASTGDQLPNAAVFLD